MIATLSLLWLLIPRFILLHPFIFFIVTQSHLCAFSPHHYTQSQLKPPPTPTSTLPLDLLHVSFIVVPVIPSPHYPLHTPLWLLLDCTQFQCLWLHCVSFLPFVDYVPVKGEIIWYLSLTTWLISLSIMLSRSIHAVSQDISSFFLSAE